MDRMFRIGSVAIALGMVPAALVAQDGGTTPTAEMEPAAVEAVKKMGAHLRGLDSFTLTADTTRDDITETGQSVEFASHLEMTARKPDGLRLDVSSDRRERQYFYDGETVTVYSPETGAFGVVEAPPTIREMLEVAARDYHVELPLADLFFWGTEADDTDALTDAFFVGLGKVGDMACDHYAFRQEGVDWQIWIRSDDPPLPCKLVITTTSEESRPRYEAILAWDTDATVDDAEFAFVPNDQAYQIPVQPAADISVVDDQN